MSGAFSKSWDELRVGDAVSSSGRTITEADVVAFGALTGDLHPQHVDREWAASSSFGERIAQGMLVIAYAVGLAPIDADRVVALRRLRDVTFKQPVRIGDTVHVRCKIRELRPVDDDLGLVDCAWEIVNQADQLAVRAGVEFLWRRG